MENSRENKRCKVIDIVKAIGIISIVIGHACNEYNYEVAQYIHWLKNYVYGYHLVVFVFCTGLLLSSGSFERPILFIKKKIKTYYISFLKFSFVLLAMKIVFSLLGMYTLPLNTVLKQIIRICIFVLNGGIDGSLWFLQLLFGVSIIYVTVSYFLTKIKCNSTIKWIIILAMGIVGCVMNNYQMIYLYRIDAMLLMLPIMHLGFFVKKYILENEKIITCRNCILTFILTTVILLFFVVITDRGIDIAKGIIGDFVSFYIISICGILWCFSIAHLIKNKKQIKNVLCVIGERSAHIMAYHLLVFKIIDYVFSIILGKDMDIAAMHPYSYPNLRVIYIIAGVIFPVIFYYIKGKLFCRRDIKKIIQSKEGD